MIGRKSASRPLAMDTDPLHHAIHFVLLHFGDVVADIINHRHIPGTRLASKHAGEGLPHAVHQQLAVGPGKVGTAGHRRKVCLALYGLQGQTGQLPVNQVETKVTLPGLVQLDIVLSYLVPKAATATVDGYDDLPYLADPQCSRRLCIIDMLDLLYLAEVVSRTKAAHLLHAAPDCRVRSASRIGTGQAAMLLGDLQIIIKAVTFLDGPGRA